MNVVNSNYRLLSYPSTGSDLVRKLGAKFGLVSDVSIMNTQTRGTCYGWSVVSVSGSILACEICYVSVGILSYSLKNENGNLQF